MAKRVGLCQIKFENTIFFYTFEASTKCNALKKKLLVYIFCVFLFAGAFAQMEEDLRTYFNDGQYFVLYGDYKEALFNFKKLYDKGIKNANINYLIGLCYMHLEGEEPKAIPYLEEASRGISMSYIEGSFKETGSPGDTYFHLGNAYQIHYEFDKAIDSYRKFIALLDKDLLTLKYAKHQIEACQRAKEAVNTPHPYEFVDLGEKINTNASNIRPLISHNDSVLYFMTRLKFYDAIFVATKNGDSYGVPKNINQEVLSDGKLYLSSIAFDSRRLFMVMDDNFNSEIYISDFNPQSRTWNPYERFKPLSSKFWESHACMDREGKKIYFTSNRTGSLGGMDIFVIESSDGIKWGKPKNLGNKINTIYNEDTPFITESGTRIYFSSQGHNSIGGYDIFYSDYIGGQWTTPINLGYPLNTPGDDLFFVPVNNGEYGYYSRINPEKSGNKEDIYIVKIK